MKGLQNVKRTNTKKKIYFNANIICSLAKITNFIAETVQHWYFTTNVQNVRRLQKHKHGDADATA